MKILRKIGIVTTLLALTVLLTSQKIKATSHTSTSFRTIKEIKKSGKLKIAVFSDKKPFGYVDNSGNFQGYDIYLGNRLAKDLGVKPEYIYRLMQPIVQSILCLIR